MSANRQAALNIETPEGVAFSYDLATPAARSLAWGVDAGAIGVASYVAVRASESLGVANKDWAGAIGAILYFVASIGYGIVLEWRWRGRTLGKRLLGLRVIDAHGMKLQLPQIVLRNLLRVVDALPLIYMVGGTACLFSRNCQRLGDLAANTVVVREREAVEPGAELTAEKYNSLAEYPLLAARLRSAASPEAVALAARALSLRDGYQPDARVRLFGDLAAYFKALAKFPDSAVEGLTDEQYLRSVLRVLYRR